VKIYIIGSDVSMAVFVANIVNQSGNSGIISEMRSDDPKEQLDDLKSNMDGAESAIVLCGNPKLFALAATKLPRIRAVACKDEEDAAEAVGDANANVIVIDDSKNTRPQIASIINGWLGGDYRPQKSAQASKTAERRQSYQHQRGGTAIRGGGALGSFKSMLGMDGDAAVESESEEPEPARQSPQKQGKPMSMPAMPKVKLPKLDLSGLKKPKNILKSMKDALGIEDG
jgi:ribose 5-phosphate isomerase RpiB